MNATDTARHAVGTVVRITGDSETNIGRHGEVVSDTGVWYRLRVDTGSVVLFRHQHVEAVEAIDARAFLVELRTTQVDAATNLLTYAIQDAKVTGTSPEIFPGADITVGDVIDGLRERLVEVCAELAAAEKAAAHDADRT